MISNSLVEFGYKAIGASTFVLLHFVSYVCLLDSVSVKQMLAEALCLMHRLHHLAVKIDMIAAMISLSRTDKQCHVKYESVDRLRVGRLINTVCKGETRKITVYCLGKS